MCDASDYAVGAVLGQRKEKVLYVIYYANHLSRLRYDDGTVSTPIDDSFPDDHFLALSSQSPWFADYENNIVGGLYKRCVPEWERADTISMRYEMPQNGILEVEVFDWVEVVSSPTNDAKTVISLFKKIIFPRFEVPRALISDGGSHFHEKHPDAFLRKYGVLSSHRTSLPPSDD
ncbi:uncharacterized protein [Spinacia oleracea]|uniref:Integrase catalytic domain-containing protein n=1 Tax=Spinacia oleracea TaxID=3562 RepID=A0ABM3RJB8_SPIOL|nr:uncharacterized protein LOC130470134 [Spinacia oleracea]